jgi:hypothetical protein
LRKHAYLRPPSNSAAAADGNRVAVVVGATLSLAIATAERQTLGGLATTMIKDRDSAAKALAAAFHASRTLDESIHVVIAAGKHDEITAYKRAVGGVMGEILFRILNPIIAEHPELAPKEWASGTKDG